MGIFEKLAMLGITPLEDLFRPFSNDEVVSIEQQVGATLPADYRGFLLAYGGSTFSCEVDCRPTEGPLYFGWFYDFENLSIALENLRETLPGSLLPIGDDAGDIVFCLGVKGNDSGRVFVYNNNFGWGSDADEYLERGDPVPDNLRYEIVKEIAASFSTFVDNMEGVDGSESAEG